MIKACVIGWPITHSRSPLIHNYWLKKLEIEGSYERVAVEPQNLATFLKALARNGYAGCNVTLPHKEAAVAIIDYPDDNVRAIGAVNTIYLKNEKLHGESTDGDGFLRNVLAQVPNLDLKGKTVCILGAGGSAKAIVERLVRFEIGTIHVINRTIWRAQELQNQFGAVIKPTAPEHIVAALQNCDVLINTTSQGMAGQPPLGLDLAPLPKTAIVCDIVYVPLKTDLIKRAEARGNTVVSGLGMLLHQAVRGFELWFGQKPVVTQDLYNLVARDVDPEFKP